MFRLLYYLNLNMQIFINLTPNFLDCFSFIAVVSFIHSLVACNSSCVQNTEHIHKWIIIATQNNNSYTVYLFLNRYGFSLKQRSVSFKNSINNSFYCYPKSDCVCWYYLIKISTPCQHDWNKNCLNWYKYKTKLQAWLMFHVISEIKN